MAITEISSSQSGPTKVTVNAQAQPNTTSTPPPVVVNASIIIRSLTGAYGAPIACSVAVLSAAGNVSCVGEVDFSEITGDRVVFQVILNWSDPPTDTPGELASPNLQAPAGPATGLTVTAAPEELSLN